MLGSCRRGAGLLLGIPVETCANSGGPVADRRTAPLGPARTHRTQRLDPEHPRLLQAHQDGGGTLGGCKRLEARRRRPSGGVGLVAATRGDRLDPQCGSARSSRRSAMLMAGPVLGDVAGAPAKTRWWRNPSCGAANGLGHRWKSAAPALVRAQPARPSAPEFLLPGIITSR